MVIDVLLCGDCIDRIECRTSPHFARRMMRLTPRQRLKMWWPLLCYECKAQQWED